MAGKRRGCAARAALAALGLAGGVAAAEAPALAASPESGWPQWRGPRRDGVSSESGLLPSWPEGGPRRLWKAGGIGRGYSSPVVSGGSLYVTGDEGTALVVRAFSLAGEARWAVTNGNSWTKSYPGARSSCAVDGGRVYHLNAHGDLVCLEAADGKTVWSVNVLERYAGKNITWGLSESVLVDGGRVYATPAGSKGLAVALDKRTGAELWASPAIEGESASYSSPVMVEAGARRLLVNCGSKHAFAVDAESGARLWSLPHLDPKNTVNVTPLLCGKMLLFTNASRDGGFLFGVPLADGPAARAWQLALKVGHGGLVCVGGRLYGASSKGELSGWISADAATGALAQALPPAALADGSAVFADGRLYCLTAKGQAALLEVAGPEVKLAGAFQLVDKVQDAWAHPVVCGRRLYLRYHDALFCYDIGR